ncbi:MAG: hypothetical protein HOP08_19770 [Cyclobacteriaceae bacterium]|nr:hypothetical protein [Cyclobacteriaceae bacterium]
MYRILIMPVCILIIGLTRAQSQSGHMPATPAMCAFFNTDRTRCLTVSSGEAVMWDYVQKKPIWTKKAEELGKFIDLSFGSVTTDPSLTYMLKRNNTDKPPFIYLVNLNTFALTNWGWQDRQFAADGQIPVRDWTLGKNKSVLYMIDPVKLTKEKIAEDFESFWFEDDKNTIVMYKEDKKGGKVPVAYYDVKEKKLRTGKTAKAKTDENPKFYRVSLTQRNDASNRMMTSVKCEDEAFKPVKEFQIRNAGAVYLYTPSISRVSLQDNTVTVVEYANMPGKAKMLFSFVNTYNYLTGELLESMELTDTSETGLSMADAELKKRKEAAEEQNRINNLPENILKQRINMLSFEPYYISLKTGHIYKIQADKGPFENKLVSLEAITGLGNYQVFENIDNLENRSYYKAIKNYQTCPVCQGKSVTQTYKEREIDQTLSSGRKIVETTVNTQACTRCGGCGVVPK